MYAIYETWHRRKGQRTCHTLNVGEVRRGREQLRDEENSRTNLPWLDRRLLEKASSRMRSTLNVEQDHLPPRERERELFRSFNRSRFSPRDPRRSREKSKGKRDRRFRATAFDPPSPSLSLALDTNFIHTNPSRRAESMKSLFTGDVTGVRSARTTRYDGNASTI